MGVVDELAAFIDGFVAQVAELLLGRASRLRSLRRVCATGGCCDELGAGREPELGVHAHEM
jgi:hypothetical protein